MDLELTPKQLKQVIPAMIEARVPLMIWGPPGIGKSACVEQVTRRLNRNLRTVPLSAMDPVDLHGAPVVTEENGAKYLEFVAPKLLPRNGNAASVLFLDEINAASPAMQPVCYSLLYGGRIGDYQLPDNCYVIAAGNRQEDKAVAHRMSTALNLRMCHVTLEANLGDTIDHGAQKGWAPEVLAYLMHKPEYLCDFDPQQKVSPVPRQWEHVSDAVKVRHMLNGILPAVVCGLIGVPAGLEFISYLDVLKTIVPPQLVLQDPMGVDIPKEASTRLMVALSVVNITTADTMPQCLRFTKRLGPELEALCAKRLNTKPECTSTAAWQTWCVDHQDLFAKP